MVTRSSLVWVMTGIAAGIAGGWLWNPRARNRCRAFRSVGSARANPLALHAAARGARHLSDAVRRSERCSSAKARRRRSSRIVSPFTSRPTDREQLAAMIADARALANPVERRKTLEVLLLRYAELDVAGALGQALENDRETAAHLLAALTAVAPEQTWERARQVTNPAERFAYLGAVGKRGRAGSGACVRQGRRPACRMATQELLQSVVTAIADRDPRLAIRLAESQGTVVSGSLIELIATQWSRHNPSAARWVEGPPAPEQARYAYRVADAYVAQKPSEALAWGLRLAGSPQRYLWSSMLGEMAKYDPDQALQIAQAAESRAARPGDGQGAGRNRADESVARDDASIEAADGRHALGDPR